MKEFHIFSTSCSRSSPGIWTLFLEALCSGNHLPLCGASHLKIWTQFLFAVTWRWDGVLGGSDAFFAPPGCLKVERQFLEPLMAKSSLPSRALHAN